MARSKSQETQAPAQETATDESNDIVTPEPATQQPAAAESPAAAAADDTGGDAAAVADASAPPPADDESGNAESPESVVVLILRDETVDGVDYRPGATPELPGAAAAALIARRVADANPKAIATARLASGEAVEEERVIE